MKKFSILLIIILASLAPASVRAASLDDAHRAFAEGRYHHSVLGYQAVLAEKGYSAPVLFDLGNAYYREGDFAQAILAYKRAQWLAPGDRDVAANLRQAEAKAGLASTQSTLPERLARKLSTWQWSWIGCGAWSLFCLSILGRAIAPRLRPLFLVAGAGGAVVLVAAIVAVSFSSRELGEAIVTDKNAAVLISPFSAAQKVFAPSPGETVTVEKEYENFLLVTDPAGQSGWISKTQITPIIPSA